MRTFHRKDNFLDKWDSPTRENCQRPTFTDKQIHCFYKKDKIELFIQMSRLKDNPMPILYPHAGKAKILETQKNLIKAYFKELGYSEEAQVNMIRTLFHRPTLDEITVYQATQLLNDLTKMVNLESFKHTAKPPKMETSHNSKRVA
jgi:hypothetical protein